MTDDYVNLVTIGVIMAMILFFLYKLGVFS
jgi:hypothetical protein